MERTTPQYIIESNSYPGYYIVSTKESGYVAKHMQEQLILLYGRDRAHKFTQAEADEFMKSTKIKNLTVQPFNN